MERIANRSYAQISLLMNAIRKSRGGSSFFVRPFSPCLMSTHRRTAAHGWRDFFVHIATIVIGLLIALGLEQSAEAIPPPTPVG